MRTALSPKKKLIGLVLLVVAILLFVASQQARKSAPDLAAADGCTAARVRDLHGLPDSVTLQGDQLQALIDQCRAVAAQQSAATKRIAVKAMVADHDDAALHAGMGADSHHRH